MINNLFNILIVEDDKISQMILKHLINNKFKNIDVYIARDGLEGVKLYKEIKPNMVFMDIHMPKMGGVDCLKEIRKIEKENKYNKACIIIYTADVANFNKNKKNNISDYVDIYLHKPIELEQSIGIIQEKYSEFLEGVEYA
jgi:CheY-like chemotaxis protein